MRKIISSITPHNAAKLIGILYGIFAILMVPIGIIMLAVGGKNRVAGFFFILAPFFYAFAGYLFTYAACWIYNVLAKRFGGVEITMVDIV